MGSQPPVTAVERSENAKLGLASATYASQASCPRSCPLLGKSCYAEFGPLGILTRRLNTSSETNALAMARAEARLIDRLSGESVLRLHVVGDARTPGAARALSQAAKRYTARRGQRVWTYTHAWRRVPRASWGCVSVLASCQASTDAREAMRQGYAAALVLDRFQGPAAYDHEGLRIIPCPWQTRKVTCSQCRLCMDDARLREAGLAVGFEAHGARANTVRKTLEVING